MPERPQAIKFLVVAALIGLAAWAMVRRARAPASPRKIYLEATAHIMSPLASLLQSHPAFNVGGAFSRYDGFATKAHKVNILDESGSLPGSFPARLHLSVDREKFLDAAAGESHEMLLRIFLCLNGFRVPCANDASLIGYKAIVKIDPSTLRGDEPIHLGDIHFTHALEVVNPLESKAECSADPEDFSGTITPTAAFLARAPAHAKFALALFPYGTQMLQGQFFHRGEASDPWRFAYQAEFFDPRKGEFRYRLPIRKMARPDYLNAFVMVCAGSETLESCVNAHFPGQFPAARDGKGFQLVPKGLRYQHCARSRHADFYLHWFEPYAAGSHARVAKERDPSLPEEIIEGQLF